MEFSLAPKPWDFDKVWPELEETVTSILTGKKISHSVWRDCFYHVYRLCIACPNSHCVKLYRNLKCAIEKLVDAEKNELMKADNGSILLLYYQKWQVYSNGSSSVDDAFRYLNLEYINKQSHADSDFFFNCNEVPKSNFLPVKQLVITTWKERLLEPILPKITAQMLAQIERNRDGQPVDCTTIVGVINSFLEVDTRKPECDQFYSKAFEVKHIEATKAYYEKVSTELLKTLSVSEYMQQVMDKLECERMRAVRFLPVRSVDKVIKVCQEVLVHRHCSLMLALIPKIMDSEMEKDLKNVYTLLKSIPEELKELVAAYENHVKEAFIKSISLLKTECASEQFVDEILRIHDKYSEFTKAIFEGHQEFNAALDRACLQAVNHRKDNNGNLKAAEWLVKYSDRLLRLKTSKDISETELSDNLNKVILVLRYVEEKDVFKQVYGIMMAKRLISGASRSLTGEEMMVSLLKTSCGYEFVSKFARMIMDVAVSRQFSAEVNAYMNDHGISADMPFTVMVLQSGAWPIAAKNGSLAVPSSVVRIASVFEEVYRKNHNGRKLTWMYNLGSVEVALSYLTQPYSVVMSLHQCVILQCFNNVNEKTIKELMEETCIESPEALEKNIQPLVESGILLRHENKGSASVVHLNMNFYSKYRKVKIQIPAMKMQDKEKESGCLKEDIEVDRKHLLECIVVRVMKQHKVMKHNTLIKETISAAKSRFAPDVPFIKQTIENLIDKNYLKRTDNAEEYAYLA